ncbi:MAG: hypothetical protein IT440_12900, partial [Phycisphaeraceae bacterium]|nr:hypothetical protein [Phycisphaeraceae bacterium]
TTALAFAKILLCQDAQRDLAGQVIACDQCDSCRLLADSAPAHPDLHVIAKESAAYHDKREIRDRKQTVIPVEVIRDFLIDPVYRAPQMRHNKVFVVDEAELLNTAGQNALLKTLEEPPAATYLILVTSHEDRLLPTIRSRCQRVSFVPLTDEVVSVWLAEHADGLDESQRKWLVEFAGGSLGRAALAVQYNLQQWSAHVVDAVGQMLKGQYPTELGEQMAAGIDQFAQQWVKDHDNASKEAANKLGAGLMFHLLGQHARGKLNAATAAMHRDPQAIRPRVEAWLAAIDTLQQAERHVASNVNLTIAGEHLVWSLFRSLRPIETAI